MKKVLFLLLAITTTIFSTTALAAEQNDYRTFSERREAAIQAKVQQERLAKLPRVGVIYVNDAQTTYNSRIDKFVLENLHECISDKTYQYIDGLTFIDKLVDYGLQDLATAERADIIDALADENLDYVVYLEIEPVTTKSKATVFSKGKSAIVTAPIKVIDIKNNRTLYNGEITQQGKTTVMMGKIGNKSVVLEGVKLVNEQVKEILAKRLPK